MTRRQQDLHGNMGTEVSSWLHQVIVVIYSLEMPFGRLRLELRVTQGGRHTFQRKDVRHPQPPPSS